jgi:hypothetical protein
MGTIAIRILAAGAVSGSTERAWLASPVAAARWSAAASSTPPARAARLHAGAGRRT